MTRANTPRQLAAIRMRSAPVALTHIITPVGGGAAWRFTDHDVFLDRFTTPQHSPFPGVATLNHRQIGGVQTNSTEIQGPIDVTGLSPPGITIEDLRAGRLIGAEVETVMTSWEACKDRLEFRLDRYEAGEPTWDEREWQIPLYGLTSRLGEVEGNVFSVTCSNELGVIDAAKRSYCGVNLQQWPFGITADPPPQVINVTSRRVFEVGKSPPVGFDNTVHAPGYFARGYVIFREQVSGELGGLQARIRRSTPTGANTQEIELVEALPFDLTTAAQCDVFAGCDKLAPTCRDKFGAFQGVNGNGGFNGHPHMRGIEGLLRDPSAS